MRIKIIALFIGLALMAACDGTDTSVDNVAPFIVGGTPTNGYPAVASLYAGEPGAEQGSLCTGTFISDTVFLTAAHCLHPDLVGATAEFQIWRGHDITDPSTRCPCHTVADVHYHPSFNPNSINAGSDIAVAVLAEPIEVDTLPYMRSSLTSSMVGDPANIVGYGVNNGWNLKGAGIKRVATVELNSYNDLYVKTGQWGKNICNGDSGGPVIMDVDGEPTVVGVNSFGFIFCLFEASSTRVDSYLPFIEQWLDPIECLGVACGEDGICVVNEDDKPQCVCPQGSIGDGYDCELAQHWKRHEISDQAAPIYVFSADLDADGDLDLVVTSNDQSPDYKSEISWYRNNLPNDGWTKSVIWSDKHSDPVIAANGITGADIDGDGFLEIIVATGQKQPNLGGQVLLFDASTGDPAGDWHKQELLASPTEGYWKIYSISADSDAYPDIVVGGSSSGKLLINPGQAGVDWQIESMSEGSGVSIFVGDVNGDGREDVVHSNYYSKKVLWTNIVSSEDGLSLTDYPIAEDVHMAFDVNLIDVDGDHRNEVLLTALYQKGFYYYSHPETPNQAWTLGWIKKEHTGTDIYTGDIDSDGQEDIAVASFGIKSEGIPASLAWFEKRIGPSGMEYKTRWIDYGTNPTPADFELQDVDGDGDLDVLTGSMANNKVYWYENRLNPRVSPTL